MDEQLKEWLKDVDDKCEYSDEAIDVQTFTDMLSSYFVDYRILLYEKEKKALFCCTDGTVYHGTWNECYGSDESGNHEAEQTLYCEPDKL